METFFAAWPTWLGLLTTIAVFVLPLIATVVILECRFAWVIDDSDLEHPPRDPSAHHTLADATRCEVAPTFQQRGRIE